MTTDTSPLEKLLEDFRTFRASGIHGLEYPKNKWPNKTICVVIHNQQIKIFRNEPGGEMGRHAEEDVIKELKTEGKTKLYINWSPCDRCCELLLKWLEDDGKNAKLSLTFAGLYLIEQKTCKDDGCTHTQKHKERNKEQLARLSCASNIKVKTFEEKDWEFLFRCLHSEFYRETYMWKDSEARWKTSLIKEDEGMKKNYEDILNHPEMSVDEEPTFKYEDTEM